MRTDGPDDAHDFSVASPGGFVDPEDHVPTEFEVKLVGYARSGKEVTKHFSLVGKRTLSVSAQELNISVNKPRPFWFGAARDHRFHMEKIVNANVSGRDVRFEVDQSEDAVEQVHLRAADAQAASQIMALLPTRVMDLFPTPETALSAQEQGERSEFQARLDTVSPNAPLTSLIVAINVIYFVLMALNGAGWMEPNGEVTVRWGSNFGPVTLDGQWWRLFTSTFIHFGLIHLALNMFALYETGRLVERIYGSVHFLLLYVLSGVAGSIVSLLWHPQINSAGASGAIFGVFGGLLVFVLNAKNAMPSSIMKEHRNSTVVFIAYNLFNGFTHAGIDNGAHIGGLLGGMAFGWLLSRPLDIIARTKLLTPRFLGSIAASLVLLAAISYPLTHPSGDVIVERAFEKYLQDFGPQESEVLAAFTKLVEQSQSKKITDTDFADALDKTIVPQWRHWHELLTAMSLNKSSEKYQLHQTLLRYVDARLSGFQLFAQAMRNNDEKVAQQGEEAMKRSETEIENIKQLTQKK